MFLAIITREERKEQQYNYVNDSKEANEFVFQ